MMFRAAILSTLLAVASAQACSICGDDKEITKPGAIFSFPGQPSVPCGDLQAAGAGGQIPIESCPFLPGLVVACECADIVVPTSAPITPTQAPVVPTGSCPSVPSEGCNICGEGSCITKPDAIFAFPGQPAVPCSDLQLAGFQGSIPLDQCGLLVSLIGACECASGVTATPAPVAPTSAPTSAPVAPTMSPEVVSTDAPISAAPVAPTAPTPFPVFVLTPAPVEPTMAPDASDTGKKQKGMRKKGKMGSESEDKGKGKNKSSRRLSVTEGVTAGVRGI